MKKEDKKEKKKFKDIWNDKRERAKLELILYGAFFLFAILFIKISSSINGNNNINNNSVIDTTFINKLEENYEFDMIINIDNDSYYYSGKRLGNNGIINIKDKDSVNKYNLINLKYYKEIDGNFILCNEKDVYPYIDKNYLDINSIKEYVKLGIKDNDSYKVKVSDIILNSDSSDNITITIDEEKKSIFIDYTNLFDKMTTVNITYSNIGNIMSLVE